MYTHGELLVQAHNIFQHNVTTTTDFARYLLILFLCTLNERQASQVWVQNSVCAYAYKLIDSISKHIVHLHVASDSVLLVDGSNFPEEFCE